MQNSLLISRVLIVIVIGSVVMVSLTALQARREPIAWQASCSVPVPVEASVAPVALVRVLPAEGEVCPESWQPLWAGEVVSPARQVAFR